MATLINDYNGSGGGGGGGGSSDGGGVAMAMVVVVLLILNGSKLGCLLKFRYKANKINEIEKVKKKTTHPFPHSSQSRTRRTIQYMGKEERERQRGRHFRTHHTKSQYLTCITPEV